MTNKHDKRVPGVKDAAPKQTAKSPLSVGPAIGDTRIKVLVPGAEAGEQPARHDTANYPPSAVLKVKGDREYEIAKQVACGGMGVIYAAKDRSCERLVAVKLMTGTVAVRKKEVGRFIQEAKITSQLEHPNIVPVHELGNDVDGMAYYTMKYVRGVTLTAVLNGLRAGKLDMIERFPLERLLTVFQKVCDAVAFAHSRGVVHCDLKPSNIMIGDYGEVLVLDWGLAQQAKEAVVPPRNAKEAQGDELETAHNGVLGTPGFMAPEQARSDSLPIDARTDIYALGAILYSILTLRSPVKGKSLTEVLRKIISGDIVPPAAYNPWKGTKADETVRFPHCSGNEIPAALSEIAMKAMAVDANARYPSVQELQKDVEAYQNGLTWHLVIDEDFSTPEKVLTRWEVFGGQYEIKEGEFRLYGGEPQFLMLKGQAPGDVRLEFECRLESAYLNDVGCFIGAVPSANGKEIPSSGYEFKYGGFDNSLNFVTRSSRRIWSQPASSLVRGQKYTVCAERLGSLVKWTVNGNEICKIVDSDPLSGGDRTAVGVLGWAADTRYTRIKVHVRGTPWKSDVLDMAGRQLQKGHYETAKDLFQEVMDAFPNAERLARARRGYEAALNRENMADNLPVWRAQLEAAWPGASIQLRMNNDQLTVEVSDNGIESLEPLKGMPVTTLYCAYNRIRSLEPLRGMNLEALHCNGNPIESLEPLRGMKLVTLLCEYCRIDSLDPLTGMPLTLLNCGGNRIENLETLRGMPLTFLSFWGNRVSDLGPLAGMGLTTLHCNGNQVSDLSPLKGIPMVTLNCSGNRIESLEPLREMPLTVFHCSENQITDLEPLKGKSLKMISCQSNRIRSLAPMKGMSLGSLTCGGNELTDIAEFVKNPPQDFLFDCDTIPARELEFLHNAWSRDFRFARHARNVEVILAFRKGDVPRLKALANEFHGHRYLFIPKFMKWGEAKTACETLGGHLVTLTSHEENEFLTTLFPYGSWVWMGLQTTESGQEWMTGEDFSFNGFVDKLREREVGPKVFSVGKWYYDVFAGAHNCFVVEWES